MGRTREALFSMLEARGVDWASSRVLDVFAGSGSLSFEAVSRGAGYALLLENDPQVLRTIEANIRLLGVESAVHVLADDAVRVLRKGTLVPFEVVFLDPPYRKNYAQQTLPLLSRAGWLTQGSFVVAELEHDLTLAVPASFELITERLFGQTRVLLLRYMPSLEEKAMPDARNNGQAETEA